MVMKHSQIVETAFLGGKMYNNNEFYYISGGEKKSLNLANISVSTFQRNRTSRPISISFFIYKYI